MSFEIIYIPGSFSVTIWFFWLWRNNE